MNDLRYALRMLRKNPGFTAVAVLTLALGIGATTTVFSIVNGVLLTPLEYPGFERIAYVYESDAEKGFQQRHTSPANFVDWRRESQAFEALAFTAEHSGMTTRSFIYTGDGLAERLIGRFVTTNYFKVFGVNPMLGRGFTPEEELSGAKRLVVISHSVWSRIYDSDPNVLGRSINLENAGRHSYEIIGVMPPGFNPRRTQVWVSCAHMPRPMTRRGGAMLSVVGRLKPGVSLAQAGAELNAIQARIHRDHGHLEQRSSAFVMGSGVRLQPLLESTVGNVRLSLMIFSGAVVLVLLIACANVANLLLSRAVSRRREISVRAALGAGRWRIIRQLLCESVVLSLSGGLVGVLLAFWGTKLVVQFSAGSIPRMEQVAVDGQALLFTVCASLLAGLIFGLAPAWQSSKANLNSALKDGMARVAGGVAHHRMRGAFTVAQVALALVLLVGAGLLLRSFDRLEGVEPGFDTEELLAVDLTMTGAAYEKHSQRRIFLQGLIERLRNTPGVEAACAVTMIPDRGGGWPTEYARLDQPSAPAGQRPLVGVRVLTPGFLGTYGIQLLRGRDFNESDAAEAPRVLLINQAFADQVFPGEDPVGQQIECGGVSEIVGVIANVKNTGLTGETRPEVFGCYLQWEFQSTFLTVRTSSNPMGLVPVISEQVRALNPVQPLVYFRTIEEFLDGSKARPRFRSMLLGLFALVALLLASVGIYGVMAYSVAQRTNEIGIRMALGAQRSDVVKLVLRQGMRLALAGVGIGILASLGLTRVLESQLFGVTTTDPMTFLSVPLLLSLVALAACIIPAVRAMRVKPMAAVKYE